MKTQPRIIAGLVLALGFFLAFTSSWNESAIFDETAHIGAGYSYVTQRDMRLNPEHPPLVKDLAGLPLAFLDLKFPLDTKGWDQMINGQWDQGGEFIFSFGNDADLILRAARFPIMLLALLTGIFIFCWTERQFGSIAALLATFFWALSPTVIAHSRYVTTDIAASFGFLIGIAVFVWFIKTPTTRRIVTLGIVFGITQVLKFSLFLLIPIYIVLAGMWLLVTHRGRIKDFFKNAFVLYLKIGCAFVIGAGVIWTIYLWHVWDYPQERQLRDAQTLVGTFRPQAIAKLDYWLIEHRATRPLGQYLLGVMMVTQRTAGGNSAYFWGEVSADGWAAYFPTVYLLKETLALHIFAILALGLSLLRIMRARSKSLSSIRAWIHTHFAVFASIFFVAFYWASSIANPLNIGVRHVLPTFPFIYILTARQLALWILPGTVIAKNKISLIYQSLIRPLPKILFAALMLIWMGSATISSWPHYLSYYNELAGGTHNGWYFATDSNYDWGQDLKRLRDFALANPDEKIYLHYFGGSAAGDAAQRYWLGNQFSPWYSSFGPPPSGSIFAISINELAGKWAKPIGGFPAGDPKDAYPWLRGLQPFGRAGTAIFLYRMP
ncbi:MAG: phospholipid carrier-dependent glycosyltransferase [Candidatus Ryanbacteria bacterium]|nr:phospholipid carrier-dependent glycosyltransferase [Candidatus Ryanbacteria bacterium]